MLTWWGKAWDYVIYDVDGDVVMVMMMHCWEPKMSLAFSFFCSTRYVGMFTHSMAWPAWIKKQRNYLFPIFVLWLTSSPISSSYMISTWAYCHGKLSNPKALTQECSQTQHLLVLSQKKSLHQSQDFVGAKLHFAAQEVERFPSVALWIKIHQAIKTNIDT